MRRWREALGCVLAAALVACPRTTTEPGDAGRPHECEQREDCPAGKVCTAELYCDSCDSSGQCLLREQCAADTRLCVLRDGWGSACATNDACPAGSWCMQGLCKDRAQVHLCPTGSRADCPTGLRCNTVNLVCEEDLGCGEDADCSPGEVCNTGSHQCVPRCTIDTQAQVCAAGERCVDSRCVQCVVAADCGVGLSCDAAGRCATAARCYADRDCSVPLVCYLPTGACLPPQPPCSSDEGCTAAQRCNVANGRCVPRACQPDRFEPDNDQAHAFNLTGSRYTDLTLCPGDLDWYSVQLARGDQLGINLDADPFAESTFSTVIKDGSGRTLAAGKLLVSYVASASALHYVAVSSTDPYQTYDLNVLLSRGTPCDDDGYEPNDAPAQATLLNGASAIDGVICPQDHDHFQLAVPPGKGAQAALTHYDGSRGLLRLCLVDGATTLACSEEPQPQVSAAAATAGGKTLLVLVSGTTDRTANAYTLEVALP